MSNPSQRHPFGTTSLVFGRRVEKTHPRVQASGSVDELNSALGLCRAHLEEDWDKEQILAIQKDLIALMSELSTDDADQERFLQESKTVLREERLNALLKEMADLDASLEPQRHWMFPGDTVAGAFLDQARTRCRDTERFIWILHREGLVVRHLLLDYLNRLSKFLWMLERRQTQLTAEKLP